MLALGARIASAVGDGGALIFLSGELGAGKTTLVRGFLRALGHVGAVKSPTYTLVEPYRIAGRDIFHFDLYRLTDPSELAAAGLREHFIPESVCLVEWPEKGIQGLPAPDLHVHLAHAGTGREADIVATGLHGKAILDAISNV